VQYLGCEPPTACFFFKSGSPGLPNKFAPAAAPRAQRQQPKKSSKREHTVPRKFGHNPKRQAQAGNKPQQLYFADEVSIILTISCMLYDLFMIQSPNKKIIHIIIFYFGLDTSLSPLYRNTWGPNDTLGTHLIR